MKLAIVGSQRFYSDREREQAKLWVYAAIVLLAPEVVVSGGAEGVDTWAEDQATKLSVETRIFHPEAATWAAYKARNILIAQECDQLVSIRWANARTYGSGWTADYAQKLGKPVKRIVI